MSTNVVGATFQDETELQEGCESDQKSWIVYLSNHLKNKNNLRSQSYALLLNRDQDSSHG